MGLETITRGSKIYDQKVFRKIFAAWRTFIIEKDPSLEEISDEDLFRILVGSASDYSTLSSQVSTLKREHDATQLVVDEMWTYIRTHIFDTHPPLKSYLKSFPQLKHGTTQRPIRTYDTHTLEYDPPINPDNKS